MLSIRGVLGEIYWWGCALARDPKKGGLRCGYSQKKGILGAGAKKGGIRCKHNQTKGASMCGYNQKKGPIGTVFVKRERLRN